MMTVRRSERHGPTGLPKPTGHGTLWASPRTREAQRLMFRCPGRGLTGFLRRHQKARLPVGLGTRRCRPACPISPARPAPRPPPAPPPATATAAMLHRCRPSSSNAPSLPLCLGERDRGGAGPRRAAASSSAIGALLPAKPTAAAVTAGDHSGSGDPGIPGSGPRSRRAARRGRSGRRRGCAPRRRACADDTAEVIRHRLDVFTETTSPLIDYYRDRGILAEVDGDQAPESITAGIQAHLPAR